MTAQALSLSVADKSALAHVLKLIDPDFVMKAHRGTVKALANYAECDVDTITAALKAGRPTVRHAYDQGIEVMAGDLRELPASAEENAAGAGALICGRRLAIRRWQPVTSLEDDHGPLADYCRPIAA